MQKKTAKGQKFTDVFEAGDKILALAAGSPGILVRAMAEKKAGFFPVAIIQAPARKK